MYVVCPTFILPQIYN